MATIDTHSPELLIPVEEESSPGMDYASHVRTFNTVLGAAEWFVVHVLILLAAVYCFLIIGQPGPGTFLVVCSLGLLVYALLRRPSVRAEVIKGIEAGPAANADGIIDSRRVEHDRAA
jgi:hypothetical protein